jgi:hypothetical protein
MAPSSSHGPRGPGGTLAGVVIAVVEAATVLVLRAHYTMDVFAAVMTALVAASVADSLAPVGDRVVALLVAWPLPW